MKKILSIEATPDTEPFLETALIKVVGALCSVAAMTLSQKATKAGIAAWKARKLIVPE